MKKIFYILALLPMAIVGQTQTENYIKTTYFKKPTSQGPVDPNNPTDASIKVTYYDGLGRPIQEVVHKQSGTGNDFVKHIQYDGFGRQVKEFLPIVSSQSLNYRIIDSTSVSTYYSTQSFPTMVTTGTPFSEKMIEKSPLNRVLEQAAPGNDWGMNNSVKHTVRLDFQTNTATEVKLFEATTTWNSSSGLYTIALSQAGTVNYAANQLFKTITKDENWIIGKNNTVEEFKDKEGRVVLKRTYSNYYDVNGNLTASEVAHDTYYVYDQFSNLTYVIPPKADTSITTTVLDELCYQYIYDYRNRLIEKKLPGKIWEYIVYDKLDRVVMTGPTRPPFSDRTDNGWLITKYDDFSRVVITGWVSSASTINSTARTVKQTERNNQASNFNERRVAVGSPTTADNIGAIAHSYTNLCIPQSGYHLLSVTYYDDYNYVGAPTPPPTVENDPVFYNNTVKPKGMVTGKWLRVPKAVSTVRNTLSYSFYDYKGRPIRSVVRNYEQTQSTPGGYTQIDSKLDFVGKPIYTVTLHKRINSETGVTIWDYYTYNNQGKMTVHTQKINSGGIMQLIAKNSYDEMGSLITKDVGGTDVVNYLGLQKVDYSYNIRGWLTGINDVSNLVQGSQPKDLFAFKINYNNVQDETNYTGKRMYNGNISETYWKTANDDVLRKYGYEYDEFNRLKNAIYQKPGSTTIVTNSYNESLTYDKNGNILTLNRNGDYDDMDFHIDDLSYTYINNSNKLMKVTDTTNCTLGFKDDSNGYNDTQDDYRYDIYGNMDKDDNKGITDIKYNHLNLPILITFGTIGTIEYVYTAEGEKLEKTVTENGSPNVTTITKYLNGFQYVNNELNFFPHDEGYVSKKSNKYSYIFNFTDHLGNVRLTYADLDKDGILEEYEHIFECSGSNCVDYFKSCILKENNTYPFGLVHGGYNDNNGQPYDYRYKFQEQERQDELGLNWDSFKYRNYDYAIGRFMSIDPLAEKYTYNSTYAFSENRVIDGRELEGLEWENFKTNQKKPGALEQKSPSENAQRQHYSVTVANSKTSFDEFKSAFLENPQDFLTNSRATFNLPVNENGGPSYFEKGSFIKIDINGPFNNAYVKVVGMENKKDKLTTTFGTMEGHMEKGKITFRLQQNEDGSISFSIDSKSEVDMGLAPEGISRSEQQKSWNEVLSNICKYLNGDVIKKESQVVEPKKK